jgi:hypothetical protein
VSGVTGATGATGITGAVVIGTSGASGASGANGTQGAVGVSGAGGTQGLGGMTGATGVTGASGAQGASGASGASGAQGANGAQGASGAQGVSGTQGTQGAQGQVGATGATGASGVQGVSGASGAQGAQGASGASGAQGAQGANGASGLSGATGATGASGAQGTQGLSGATGASGAQGAQGAAGKSGVSGVSGASGISGASGAQGAQIIGASGASGASGAQGVQGKSGASGATGATGATGGTGPVCFGDGIGSCTSTANPQQFSGSFAYAITGTVLFDGNVTTATTSDLTVNGPAIFGDNYTSGSIVSATGVTSTFAMTVSGGTGNNFTMNNFGMAGTGGIQIGAKTPGAANVVVIGNSNSGAGRTTTATCANGTSHQQCVHANLNTWTYTASSSASTATVAARCPATTDVLIGGSCSCPNGSITDSHPTTSPWKWNCTCSSNYAQATTNCERTTPGDVWTAMATIPGGTTALKRTAPYYVWTGTQLLIWGGSSGRQTSPGSTPFNAGWIYDPAADAWYAMNATQAAVPASRFQGTAVWTAGASSNANEMLIWGGETGGGTGFVNTGVLYNPATDTWTAPTKLSAGTGAPPPRSGAGSVWTGSTGSAGTQFQMIVWGGINSTQYFNDGGMYNPATDTWTSQPHLNAGTGAPLPRESAFKVGNGAFGTSWTGATGNSNDQFQMIVWGGANNLSAPAVSNTGGLYDPLTDTWTAMNTTGAPAGRQYHSQVWVGNIGGSAANKLIVYGGCTLWNVAGTSCTTITNTGGIFDPSNGTGGTWSTVNPNFAAGTGAPPGTEFTPAAYTGTSFLTLGGWTSEAPAKTNTGGYYNVATDTWTGTPNSTQANTPTTGSAPTAMLLGAWGVQVWTGTQLMIWGGSGNPTGGGSNLGAFYTPLY